METLISITGFTELFLPKLLLWNILKQFLQISLQWLPIVLLQTFHYWPEAQVLLLLVIGRTVLDPNVLKGKKLFFILYLWSEGVEFDNAVYYKLGSCDFFISIIYITYVNKLCNITNTILHSVII